MKQCDPPCPVELCSELSKAGMCALPTVAKVPPCVWRDGCRNRIVCAQHGYCDGPRSHFPAGEKP
jgi:hypothetical protein